MSQTDEGCNRPTVKRVSTLALATLGVFLGNSGCGVALASGKLAAPKTFIGLVPQATRAQIQVALIQRYLSGENTCLGLSIAQAFHSGQPIGILLGCDICNPHWDLSLQGVPPATSAVLRTQRSVTPGFTLKLAWTPLRALSVSGVYVYHHPSGSQLTDRAREAFGAHLHYALRSGKRFGLKLGAAQTHGSWKPSLGFAGRFKAGRETLRNRSMQQALHRNLWTHKLDFEPSPSKPAHPHGTPQRPIQSPRQTTKLSSASTSTPSNASHSRLPSPQEVDPINPREPFHAAASFGTPTNAYLSEGTRKLHTFVSRPAPGHKCNSPWRTQSQRHQPGWNSALASGGFSKMAGQDTTNLPSGSERESPRPVHPGPGSWKAGANVACATRGNSVRRTHLTVHDDNAAQLLELATMDLFLAEHEPSDGHILPAGLSAQEHSAVQALEQAIIALSLASRQTDDTLALFPELTANENNAAQALAQAISTLSLAQHKTEIALVLLADLVANEESAIQALAQAIWELSLI